VTVRFEQAAAGLLEPDPQARSGSLPGDKGDALAGTVHGGGIGAFPQGGAGIQIGRHIDIIQLLPRPVTMRHSLPPDEAAFTGRDEEVGRISAEVSEAASAGGRAAIQVIVGMAGVGKTALAVHLAHRLRAQFPDRQLFVNLHGHTPGQVPVPPEDALAGLLAAVGVDARLLPDDLWSRAGLWRDRIAEQRILLVLDDASSSSQVAPLLPGDQESLVLVTSRRSLADLPGAIMPVHLEALPPDQASEMFLRLAPRAAAGPAAAIAELVGVAGYLPLAISLLARMYARHPSWTLADLASETRGSLLTLAAENVSVGAALELSYRHLTSGQQQFLRRLGLHPGTTVDAFAAAALAGVSLQEAARYLAALCGGGLLTEVNDRRYGMHDLIRRFAENLAAGDPAADRDQALERLLDYYQHAASTADAQLSRRSRTITAPAAATTLPAPVPDLTDREKALAWARIERANLLASLDYAARTGQFARTVALTASLATVLRLDGPWTDAISRHSAAVQAARHLGDRLGEAEALRSLGAVRLLTGDYLDAAEALVTALGIFRDLGDRPGQARALSDLGGVRLLTGDYPEAAEALEAALATSRDLGDQPGQADALRSMGAVLRLRGDFPAAVASLTAALRIARDLGDRLSQGSALSDLGGVRLLTGDYPEAADHLVAALTIFHDRGDQLGQARALINLGAVQRLTEDYAAATATLQEALDICRYLGDRLGQASALVNLGAVQQLTGDYTAAATTLEETLRIYRDLGDLGGEADALNEAGTLFLARGDPALAEAYHRQALEIARKIGSPWSEAHALAGLGRCALAVGRIAAAAVYLRQSQGIFARTSPAEAAAITAELDSLAEA
jgi:tetratricopeptide (TPR) repeat protein